ncbi:MAG: hypothetical protein KIT09_08825 [Bryobacteraceae bacterium]|nr:hypothetical protein [Bryobacteraceae bacterium]
MEEEPRPLERVVVALVEAHQADTERLARRLHDDVGQLLTAAGLRLGLLRMDLEQVAPRLVEPLSESLALLDKAFECVRQLGGELNSSLVERIGLPASLDRLAARCQASFPGVIASSCDPSAKLPAVSAERFYRIVEAALENAIRHSGAGRIILTLQRLPDCTLAEVADDGRGFDRSHWSRNPAGAGLLLMEHYARQNSLQLNVSSAPGRGTIVTVQCSLVCDG